MVDGRWPNAYRGRDAERRGFEPLKHFWRLLTFQASQFNHSCTSPFRVTKVHLFSGKTNTRSSRRVVPIKTTASAPRKLLTAATDLSRASVLGNVEAHGLRLEMVRRWEFAHKETYHLKPDNCAAIQHSPTTRRQRCHIATAESSLGGAPTKK